MELIFLPFFPHQLERGREDDVKRDGKHFKCSPRLLVFSGTESIRSYSFLGMKAGKIYIFSSFPLSEIGKMFQMNFH